MPDGLELPRPPGAIRQFFRRRPWLTDSLLAGLYLVIAFLGVVAMTATPGAQPMILIPLVGAGAVVVLFRRRFPIGAFAAANALAVLSAAVGGSTEQILPLLTIYAVAVYRSSRAAWIGFAAGSAVALVIAVVSMAVRPLSSIEPELLLPGGALTEWLLYSVPGVLLLLIATLIGTNVGGRARYIAALVERAAQLARERDQRAAMASAEERERIAREMHDVIAHSLSVMVALAEGAAAAAPARPEQARDAMSRVAETGRRTLGEVRRLLGAVRAEAASTAELVPQPTAADLPALAEEFQRAGLPVRLAVQGSPVPDAGVGLAVYRIVQESLTNALRHARAVQRVDASVTWGADRVDIVVADDGAPSRTAGDPGRGILGIRERAALYGGTVDAGPRPDGGWRVHVTMPTTTTTPAPTEGDRP